MNHILSTVIHVYKENLKISSVIQVNFFYIESHYNENIIINQHYITGNQELETSYKDVGKVSSEVWSEVLTRLSARGEWVAIRFLVLGIDFQFINGSAVVDGISVRICNLTRILFFISLIFKDILPFFWSSISVKSEY